MKSKLLLTLLLMLAFSCSGTKKINSGIVKQDTKTARVMVSEKKTEQASAELTEILTQYSCQESKIEVDSIVALENRIVVYGIRREEKKYKEAQVETKEIAQVITEKQSTDSVYIQSENITTEEYNLEKKTKSAFVKWLVIIAAIIIVIAIRFKKYLKK